VLLPYASVTAHTPASTNSRCLNTRIINSLLPGQRDRHGVGINAGRLSAARQLRNRMDGQVNDTAGRHTHRNTTGQRHGRLMRRVRVQRIRHMSSTTGRGHATHAAAGVLTGVNRQRECETGGALEFDAAGDSRWCACLNRPGVCPIASVVVCCVPRTAQPGTISADTLNDWASAAEASPMAPANTAQPTRTFTVVPQNEIVTVSESL
jgi:hypothetical protein